LAETALCTTSGDETVLFVSQHAPEMVILSVDVQWPTPAELISSLRRLKKDVFVVAVYREMSLAGLRRLKMDGADEIISQPIDFAMLYGLVSKRFGIPVRCHRRFSVALVVLRADGVLVGKTRNLSEGGMLLDCDIPVQEQQSMLVDIRLKRETSVRVRGEVLAFDSQSKTARMRFSNLRGNEHQNLTAFLLELEQRGSGADDESEPPEEPLHE